MDRIELNDLINKLEEQSKKEIDVQQIDMSIVNELADNLTDDLIPYLFEPTKKLSWEYTALSLKKIGYPRTKLAINDLLELFMDINWPGVRTAYEILKEIYVNDKGYFVSHLEKMICQANRDSDLLWLEGLTELVNFIGISKYNFQKKEIYELLMARTGER